MRTIAFSGRTWVVKDSAGPVGPGPNHFSDSIHQVRVDDFGRLHLAITRAAAGWACAEVVAAEPTGYGTYEWVVESDLTALDPNTVVGMFTWSEQPDHAHREIDIEFSRWGVAGETRNGLYALHRGDPAAPIRYPFAMPATIRSIHQMDWRPGGVSWTTTAPGTTVRRTYTGASVPPPGGQASPRINLWLYRAQPPTRSQQLIVESFSFTPRA